MKRLAILGSTGSIGTQALDIVAHHRDLFEVEVLVANNNVELLAEQARLFQPNIVVIGNEAKRNELSARLADQPIKVYAGQEAIAQVAGMSGLDIVLVAMVGFSGLRPTKSAIDAGHDIALANKETLVVAGEFIMDLAKKRGVRILPVDSEHSAIFQCLNGERHLAPKRIILTASGGPFRGFSREQLRDVTPERALKHPNWNMGAKVTIDSASMMNKGLESIEARWLFDVEPAKIDITVHPQSVVHSLVEFEDNSIKAQIGVPDMRLPIQYALTYPNRVESPVRQFSFADYANWTFEQVDTQVFRNLAIAFESMHRGGNAPCVMNGANEIAVAQFLQGRIPFLAMPELIEETLKRVSYIPKPSFSDYFSSDREAREVASEVAAKFNK